MYEDDLNRDVGAGMVDFGSVLQLVVPEHMSAHALREVLAADLGFSPSTSAIHPCVVHRGCGGRERHVEEEVVAQGGGAGRGGGGRWGMKLLPPGRPRPRRRGRGGGGARPRRGGGA